MSTPKVGMWVCPCGHAITDVAKRLAKQNSCPKCGVHFDKFKANLVDFKFTQEDFKNKGRVKLKPLEDLAFIRNRAVTILQDCALTSAQRYDLVTLLGDLMFNLLQGLNVQDQLASELANYILEFEESDYCDEQVTENHIYFKAYAFKHGLEAAREMKRECEFRDGN